MADYELTLDARNIGGIGTIRIIFRAAEDRHYSYKLGGVNSHGHVFYRIDEHGEKMIGEPAEGILQITKWYRIRIRCQGPRIGVWLNDKQMVDYIDNNPLLSGRIGVATRWTRGDFRNIKVTDFNGKIL